MRITDITKRYLSQRHHDQTIYIFSENHETEMLSKIYHLFT